MSEVGQSLDATAAAIAQDLLGDRRAALTQIRGGGNNRVYRVTRTGTADALALKLYAPPGTDHEDAVARLHREFDGLQFLGAHGFTAVPKAIAVERDALAALYEWVDGSKPAFLESADRKADDIGAAIRFIRDLHRLSRRPGITFGDSAREACLSGDELLRQIEKRVAALTALIAESDLQDFISGTFRPALDQATRRLRDWAAESGEALATDLAPARRLLSPSDFGFHNALRRADGQLVFIDFEYFGWDDPVKLLADFVWHPAMQLSAGERAAFLGENLALLAADDPALPDRFNAQFPLYGLRWAAILLNEFFPERWQRRVFAGKDAATAETWAAAKSRQLSRARQYSQIVQVTAKTAVRTPMAALLELMSLGQ
jgi:hypothetical protein